MIQGEVCATVMNLYKYAHFFLTIPPTKDMSKNQSCLKQNIKDIVSGISIEARLLYKHILAG